MSARDVADRRSGALAMRFVGDLAAVRGWVSLGIARLISASDRIAAASDRGSVPARIPISGLRRP